MKVNLKVWRQANPQAKGGFVTYNDVETTPDTSFLETLDILNETLIERGEEPVVFDHDCREGICGMCSLYVNGHPHGPATGATTCQLYMRRFANGGHQRPYGRPQRLRQNPAGRRLRQLQLRRRTGCQRTPYLESQRRRSHGLRKLHRLRRMRGCLQERLGHALRFREDKPACSSSSG